MIIVDTNVVSDIIRYGSQGQVARWVAGQDQEDIWTTAITAYELEYGAANLPPSRRREELQAEIDRIIWQDLNARVLPFDGEASRAAAALAAKRRSAGVNVGLQDNYIAGIALSRNATLATRNTRHFADTGLRLIDPWAAA